MFKYTCAVASVAAFLAGTPAQLSAQDVPKPTSSTTVPPKASPTLPNRVFIDVNGGFQSGTHTFSDTRNDPLYGETETWTADYETKSGPAFDVSGGVRVWRNLVASVAYTSFTDTSTAGVQGGVPHPFFFNRNRAIAGEAVGLKQKEDVIHLSAMWAVPVNRSLDVRVFGGPSLYRIDRDLVEDIAYSEDGYPYDTASFNSAQVERVSADAWGFHMGGDVTWMFTQTVGLGATARFSRAETDIPSPANGDPLAFRFGGLQFGGGLRLRFGRISARKEGTTRPLPPAPEAPSVSEPTPPKEPNTLESNTAMTGLGEATVNITSGVFDAPDANGTLLRIFEAGTRVKVLEATEEWLKVEFNDPQLGARVGYVSRLNCSYREKP